MKLLKAKLEILDHQNNFINFVQELKKFDYNLLREPISAGKWSPIEIIGHFYPWDEFIIKNRIPYILTKRPLPASPNADSLNKKSAHLARHESVQNTLEKCIHIRTDLIETLNTIPEETWLVEFKINQSTLSPYVYLKGLMEHDIHHLNEIKKYVESI